MSNIINISITRNTSAAERADFGVPLFITETVPVAFTERAREYASLESMVDDGWLTTDNAYIAANQLFSQNPTATKFVVGRMDAGDADYPSALIAINEEYSDWFVLTAETRVEADVLALAITVEAMERMYVTGTNVAGSLTSAYTGSGSTDLAGKLAELGYDNTFVYWHQDCDTVFYELAMLGHNLPFLAGQSSWANISLKGVPQALNADGNPLTETQRKNLDDRNVNYSVTQYGKTIVKNGVCVSGEYIDIVRGTFALDEDLTKTLFDLLTNQKGGKIPFTNAGLNLIRGKMNTVLDRFVDRGFILPNYTIFIPDASDVSFADKAARVVTGITFEAYLQGAINSINPLRGTLTYEAA